MRHCPTGAGPTRKRQPVEAAGVQTEMGLAFRSASVRARAGGGVRLVVVIFHG
jgi:hypothetical protein